MAIQCAHVYLLRFNVAAKSKLLVPAYVLPDGKVRFFPINSEVPDFIIKSPELSKHTLPMKPANNARFLSHDSWLCCNEVIGGWTVEEIKKQGNCYRGAIDAATMAAVPTIIIESRLYAAKEKALIMEQWPVKLAKPPA